MPSRRHFLKSATLAAAAVPLLNATDEYVTADTSYGKVRGVNNGGIRTFKGIPYGSSTAGKNRFRPPTDPAKWTGVRDALEYGHSAPQTEPGKARNVADIAVAGAGLREEGEDCLVLNVWTPGVNDGKKRPVMFWCHGGGFVTGSGSSPVTEGANLAKRGDVVVVSINHRLNVLGFTYLEEFGGKEFAESGDVGMMDIVKALEWVRTNIARFGGDAGNVTIFGQSGGGRKVATLLAMPSAKGLFHRAIIESGATISLVEREQAIKVASALMGKLGLAKTQVRELQSVPIYKVMQAYFDTVREMNVDQMTMGFSPTVDGKVLPAHPFYPMASDVSPNVPLMLGSTRTELTSSAARADFSLNEEGMRGKIQGIFGDNATSIIDIYKKANPMASPAELYFLMASDHRYSAPVMKIAERRAALKKAPVYLYYFAWESPMDGGRFKSPHTIEIPFAFDNIKATPLTSSSPEAPALADKVSSAWLAFARTGDPNTAKLPKWPSYNATERATMVFNNESRVVNDPLREQRVALFRAMNLS